MSEKYRQLLRVGLGLVLTTAALASAPPAAHAVVSGAPWQGSLAVANTPALNGIPLGGVTGTFTIEPLQAAPANDIYPATLTYKIDYTFQSGCLTFIETGGGTIPGALLFDWGTLDREGPPSLISFQPSDSTSVQEFSTLIDCEGNITGPAPVGGPTFTEVKVPPPGSTGRAITGPLNDFDGVVNYTAIADLHRDPNLRLHVHLDQAMEFAANGKNATASATGSDLVEVLGAPADLAGITLCVRDGWAWTTNTASDSAVTVTALPSPLPDYGVLADPIDNLLVVKLAPGNEVCSTGPTLTYPSGTARARVPTAGRPRTRFTDMKHFLQVDLYLDGQSLGSTVVPDQTVSANYRGGRASGSLNCDGTHELPVGGSFAVDCL